MPLFAGQQHALACVAITFCSLPKAATFEHRLAHLRARQHAVVRTPLARRLALRASSLAVDGGGGGGGIDDGRGAGGGGSRGDGNDGARGDDGGDSFFSPIEWILTDPRRRAAAVAASWGYAVATSVELVQHEARREAGAPGVAGGGGAAAASASFSGEWELSASENFDRYLESVGVSALHRRYAVGAKVSQMIEEVSAGGRTALKVCVRNQLGTRCEEIMVGGPPVTSTDVRGEEVVKKCCWESSGGARVCATETKHATKGLMRERRYIRPDGTMVMELTSPSGVTALRIFRRVADAPVSNASSSSSGSSGDKKA